MRRETPSDQTLTHRSGLSILSYQLDGLCSGLRQVVPYGQPVGPLSLSILKRLKLTFESIVDGPALEGFPEVDEESSPSDVLVIAEVLRSSLLAFLSPEEME